MGIFRSPKCVVCGRSVRGMEDAREEGKLWFCSPSHHLDYRGPSGTKKRKRKVKKWVLIFVGLFVLLLILPALLAGKKNGKSASTKGNARPVAHTTGVRNSQDHPVPMGKVGGAYGGWRLRITTVRPSAVSFLGDNYLGYERQRVPPEG